MYNYQDMNPSRPRVVLSLAWRRVQNQLQFLLSQRNAPGTSIHRLWQVPGGGVEANETDEQALMREMQEEFGLEPILTHPDDPIHQLRTFTHPDGRVVEFDLYCYLVDIKQQEPIVQPDEDETLDVRWFNLDEIPKIPTFENTHVFVQAGVKLISDLL